MGNWGSEHGVQYIGYAIVDMNVHMRLGHGYFFRALDGQDMVGIDVILNQIVPGILECPNTAPDYGHYADLEFYVYTLTKLGASLAHMQAKKRQGSL